MNKVPWNSIAESLVNQADNRTLSHAEALESPCMTCPTTPCCSHLPLNTFKVTTLVELDHALYLLNFDRIELGLSASGEWSAYYVHPCRFLARDTHFCNLHGTSEQPRICQHYNPYNCWYKRVFSVGQNQDFIRIDYERMQYLLPHIELSSDRQIVAVPAWEQLIALMESFEDQARSYVEPQFGDEALQNWEEMVLHQDSVQNEQPAAFAYDPLLDPCIGCGAYCCKTLVFPQSIPQHVSNLDYYRFCLGFPGVELGISDEGWSIIVKTRCRHLDSANRCQQFGQTDRPLICKYYDAWKCSYKPQFGQARPANFLRIRLEQFQWMCEGIMLDENGVVLGVSQTQSLREHVEQRWFESKQADTL